MASKKKMKTVLVLLLPVLALYHVPLVFEFYQKSTPLAVPAAGRNQSESYDIDTPGCRMPKLNPWHFSIRHLIKKQWPLLCTRIRPFQIEAGNRVLRTDMKQARMRRISCGYQVLSRLSDTFTRIGRMKTIREETTNVTDEFVRVVCQRKGHPFFIDHFPFIQRKAQVEQRVAKFTGERRNGLLSVLLLGFDSTSKNSFLRDMTRMKEYMDRNLTNSRVVALRGYNKIGINTYPNIVAMLTGHVMDELPNLEYFYADLLPFVWKDFSESGYRTLYSQDAPLIHIFNYAKKGFKHQPTDYYLRPFNLAVEASTVVQNGTQGCFNHREESTVLLQWTLDFFDTFPKEPLFALTFFSRLTHEDINALQWFDEPIVQFIKQMEDSGHLNRTIVLFFSDHGFRIGSIRNTYMGRLEANLPFMFFLLPPWFSRVHPDLFANLKVNSRRLTTPLDIHATLHGILRLGRHSSGTTTWRKQSRSVDMLHDLVSENRTCSTANIPLQLCSCVRFQRVNGSTYNITRAALKLVEEINGMTHVHRNSCAAFELKEVVRATAAVKLWEDWDARSASRNYQVTVRVEPGDALFEGIVWHLEALDTFTVLPEIERLNVYGNQSSCVDLFHLKPYCFCSHSKYF